MLYKNRMLSKAVSSGADNKQEKGDGGSGGHSIAGYEYQIDVSVWLALDLVLANRLAQELILEPASEEDIEADLAENEPGRLTSTARPGLQLPSGWKTAKPGTSWSPRRG